MNKTLRFAAFSFSFAMMVFVANAAAYNPPSDAVKFLDRYRGYSELTNAAKGMDIDKYTYNLTTWQMDNGGFFKAFADKYKNPYSSGDKSGWKVGGKYLGTIDNNATIQEMRLLAIRYKATSNSNYKKTFKTSFNKAAKYLLDMQRTSGGFPQAWPKRKGYSDHITLNDNAMIRVMVTIMDIANGTAPFDGDIIDDATRNKMRAALEKSVDYLIRAQIVNNGVPTVWCAQHDTVNYAPRPARSYELESKSGSESAGVVWFLMNWPKQTPAVQKSVTSAINWFKKTRVPDLKFNKGNFVKSSGASLWYRFYEVKNDNYFFCDKTNSNAESAKTKTQDITKLSDDRRYGYQWAGDYGSALMKAEAAYLSAIKGISISEEYGPNAGKTVSSSSVTISSSSSEPKSSSSEIKSSSSEIPKSSASVCSSSVIVSSSSVEPTSSSSSAELVSSSSYEQTSVIQNIATNNITMHRSGNMLLLSGSNRFITTLFSITGCPVLQSQSSEIDLSRLPLGMYILKVKSGRELMTRKIKVE